jgi:hypothetical protein
VSEAGNLADPARLAILHASFRLANEEFQRRLEKPEQSAEPEWIGQSPADEAAQLAAMLRVHFAGLGDAELEHLRAELARGLLLELDRKMAFAGELPGERLALVRLA